MIQRGQVRIDELRAHAYRVPTDAPEADGTLAWDSTTLVLVRARSGHCVGTGGTYAPAAAAALVTGTLAPVVRGRSALDVPGTRAALDRAVRNASRAGLVGYTLSAVDVALWDLKARLLGLPLHRLLGAARRDVPVYGSGGFTTFDDRQLTEQLDGWAHGQRIPRVKIKIGQSWGTDVGRDLRRMALAREVVGEGTELFVDANGAYGRKQAVRVMDAARELDVRWFEEPVSSDDLAGLAQVRTAVRADVTAGEYGTDLVYFARMLDAGAVDCLQVDASRCGGVTEWLRVAALAAAHSVEVSGHCAPHLHAAVAAATPNLRHLEWFADHVRIEAMLFDGTLDPTGGALRLREAPGHGLELRAADADRYRVA
jgi:L-alanine-DL-glutamate epimerase-like enolase superfamily enzyme